MNQTAGQFEQKGKVVRHVNCGGQLSIGGEGWMELPFGFGFRGSKFVVDKIRFKTYDGFCMKCQADGLFAEKGHGKIKTSVPKSINDKIKKVGKKQAEKKSRVDTVLAKILN